MSQNVSPNCFFEGPEKKVEILLKRGAENLLNKPQRYWEHLVSLASAQILSSIETPGCKAYLLSESSLFVWSDRITLITCGTTFLIRAAEHFISDFKSDLEDVFFERKNEYYPVFQKSTAGEDIQALKSQLQGEAYRFGRKDDHHVYVYNRSFGASGTNKSSKIKTLELLMYGLQGEFKRAFANTEENKSRVLKTLKNFFPDYQIDPFFFNPEGFSFNALKEDQYATMHVTPQGTENYLSFEMDQFHFGKDLSVVQNLVKLCRPISYDVILFTSENVEVDFGQKGYELKQQSSASIPSGYKVLYQHYFDQINKNIEVTKF